MAEQFEIELPPFPRGFHLITQRIIDHLPELPEKGVLHLFICHTSAGLTINENADRTVRDDFETSFNRLIPENERFYIHNTEGSDDMPVHIKSSLVGQSIAIPITRRRLNLGTWQGIYLCEFRNRGGKRKLIATLLI